MAATRNARKRLISSTASRRSHQKMLLKARSRVSESHARQQPVSRCQKMPTSSQASITASTLWRHSTGDPSAMRITRPPALWDKQPPQLRALLLPRISQPPTSTSTSMSNLLFNRTNQRVVTSSSRTSSILTISYQAVAPKTSRPPPPISTSSNSTQFQSSLCNSSKLSPCRHSRPCRNSTLSAVRHHPSPNSSSNSSSLSSQPSFLTQ